jgi:hypothetical protein
MQFVSSARSQSRSKEQRALILSKFDTIIWDECDFAVDQIEELVTLAPHALKFGLTAANMGPTGKLLDRFFILAGVASHRTVFETDHCLRPLLNWDEAVEREFIRPIAHDGYTRWDRAVEIRGEGQHGEHHSLAGAMATIRAAIQACRKLEGDMRRDWPEDLWRSAGRQS